MRDLADRDRKSTRLNSSHTVISYAVFCLKKKEGAKRSAEHQACSVSVCDAHADIYEMVRHLLPKLGTDVIRPMFRQASRLLFFLIRGHPPDPSPFPSTRPSR